MEWEGAFHLPTIKDLIDKGIRFASSLTKKKDAGSLYITYDFWQGPYQLTQKFKDLAQKHGLKCWISIPRGVRGAIKEWHDELSEKHQAGLSSREKVIEISLGKKDDKGWMFARIALKRLSKSERVWTPLGKKDIALSKEYNPLADTVYPVTQLNLDPVPVNTHVPLEVFNNKEVFMDAVPEEEPDLTDDF